jgi:glutamate dehydrogenase (NAD(P)+)
MQTTTPTAPIPMEQETNPWLAQAARFDEAAKRLNLEPGL